MLTYLLTLSRWHTLLLNYSEEVQGEILNMPESILAHYLRLTDLLEEFGPLLRMPHSRAMGEGLIELRANGREGIGQGCSTLKLIFF